MATSLWEMLENDTIRLTGGEPTRASGRLRDKGDVQTQDLLIECKHRSHRGPRVAAQVSQDWCDTTEQHADDAEKIPLLVCGLTWTKEPVIDFRLTLCMKRDLNLFVSRTDIAPFLSIPGEWSAVTEASVVLYCKEQTEKKVDAGGKENPQGGIKGRGFGGGSGFKGNRGMQTGPSRWGR